MRARELAVGSVPCIALRVTYVGELGWELYCPAEFGLTLWDLLWAAGRPHGLVAGGYKAIDSLRLEKGYRVWGADITPEETPYQAGLGFAVKLDKGDFLGRDALAAAAASRRRCFAASRSRIRSPSRSGRSQSESAASWPVASRAAATATRSGRSIAYAYLPAEHDVGTAVEVEIFGEWVPGTVAAEPLFDPAGERIRA